MARMRTFIGVDPGKTIRDRMVALQEKLAGVSTGVKWVEPDNLHVTLLFLGEVDNRDLSEVCQKVAEVTARHACFPMTIEGVGCFPNVRRPRVLWVGVGEGAPELIALHDDLEPPLLEMGCYRREDRKYTPHVTLGRVRGERPPDSLADALFKQQKWRGGETQVHELLVMSSELTSQGPIYSILSRAKLA